MKIDNKQGPKQDIGRQGRSLIPFVIAILVVMGLIFGGWGTVYAAQDAQPDDLLYQVKVAVDYLAELTTTVSTIEDAPGQKNATSVQIKKLDQDMVNAPDNEQQNQWQHRFGALWDDDATELLLDDLDLTIDDTLATTQTMSRTQMMSMTQVMSMTQWMSGTLSMTRVMSGTLYGPGQCVGDIDNCPLDIPLGYTHTFTSGLEAPYQGDFDQQPVIDQPDPGLGFNPEAPPVKEAQEPEGNTGSTGEQKKGGKP